MNRSATESVAEATGVVLACLIAFAVYIAAYEAPRPTWVSELPPVLLSTEMHADTPGRLISRWQGHRQRPCSYCEWRYELVDVRDGAHIWKGHSLASVLSKTESGQKPEIYTVPWPAVPAGEYIYTVSEVTQMFSWLPVRWVHQQATWQVKVQ